MTTAPRQIQRLVELFDRNSDQYKSPAYNETVLRVEFVNPFWKALGWDVDNEAGYAMQYRDVVHEDAIRVGSATKAPDYSFRIGGMRKFFVETKRPSVNLRQDTSPAYQLRRYAWSSKLPLSVLTDFEEMAVYDCRIRPNQSDSAAKGRIMYFAYTDYADKWDDIAAVFHRESVLKGSFDRFAESTKAKRGTSEVDAEFLKEIEGWRETLARNIALRNPRLTVRELNFAVQKTIDRLIFLRMCEDRGIERYAQLRALAGGSRMYPRLVELYRRADEKYNSGLFHFDAEKGRAGAPDALTPALAVDDKVLKGILAKLYYPECPYEFSILPPEILGNVYEQFLGKVIRLTKGHQARVEEKPEVRKAGGVYYTPAYIVDYIVKNTVGKLCESKTPKQAAALRILDPACGSGSFLLGAYQYLLDWHLKWYTDEMQRTGKAPTVPPPKGRRKRKSDPAAIYEAAGGQWRLSTAEKKRILLNNIYGVDIDAQAVEVTKLSLLLKVLENENQETLATQLRLFHERALPDLAGNIKCGNSLIGPDYYSEPGQKSLFADEEAQYRINAFDWHDPKGGFGEIMNSGGFDAVIGNPPYVRIQAMKEWAPLEVEYYKKAYTSASKGNYDIYVVFVEKGLGLLNAHGRLGFIVPHKFFNAKYGERLRALVSQGKHLAEVVHFGDQQVFSGATTYTCLLFLDRGGREAFEFRKVTDLAEWRTTGEATEGEVSSEKAGLGEWGFIVGRSAGVLEKLSRMTTKLGHIALKIFQGLVTGADPVFILETREGGRTFSNATGKLYVLESELLHPLCKGSVNIRRYSISGISKQILFPYVLADGKARLILPEEFEQRFPNAWGYLQENRRALQARERGKWRHDRWYAFGRSQNLARMEQQKLLTPSIARRGSFALDKSDFYYFVGSGGGGGGGYGITLRSSGGNHVAYEYVLGILNSSLLDICLKSYSSHFSGGYYAYNRQYIEPLPIHPIDFSNKADVKKHDRIVALVETMLDLHKRLPEAKTPAEKTVIERRIAATDRQIDGLVYELYELTDEEIRIVEEGQ